METALQQFLEEGLAPSTRVSVWFDSLQIFCAIFQAGTISSVCGEVHPFVAFLGSQGLSISTIKSYLSELQHFRLILDPSANNPLFHSPHMAILLRGITRHQAQWPHSVRILITASLMCQKKSVLGQQSHTYFHWLLWAACCVVFWLS